MKKAKVLHYKRMEEFGQAEDVDVEVDDHENDAGNGDNLQFLYLRQRGTQQIELPIHLRIHEGRTYQINRCGTNGIM